MLCCSGLMFKHKHAEFDLLKVTEFKDILQENRLKKIMLYCRYGKSEHIKGGLPSHDRRG